MAHGPLRMHLMVRRHIVICEESCVGCGLCMRSCPVGTAIAFREGKRTAYVKNPLACGGCGACLRGCPANAIHIVEDRPSELIERAVDAARAPGQPEGQARRLS